MSDLIKRAAVLELIAQMPTAIGPGGSALVIPPEVFRRNVLDAVKSVPPAAALTEAQETIARQQVMLDRALENGGDLMIENARLKAEVERLRRIVQLGD